MINMKLYRPAKVGYLVLADEDTVKGGIKSLIIEGDVPTQPWNLNQEGIFDAGQKRISNKREFIKERLTVVVLEHLAENYTTKQKANAIFNFLSSSEGTLWLFAHNLKPKTLRVQEIQFISTVATYLSGYIKRS